MKQKSIFQKRVLVVDDEADIRELLDLTLARMGFAADCVGSLAEARERLAAEEFQLCISDMRLPDGLGLELVQHIGEHYPKTLVAVITAFGSMENAVAALKAGAFDYLSKPVSLDQLRALVKTALGDEKNQTPAVIGAGGPSQLIGHAPVLEELRSLIARTARSQSPIHIHGESGSGKELVARAVHQAGPRSEGPFVPVNCGAIPEMLMESEFFGHVKGSFTGADDDHEGFFQAAQGGTLFLDEVADLPMLMQVKLLRAIQEKKVRRVGSSAEVPVDVRIVSATHQNLRAMVEVGRFRQDLYFRLNVIELATPPLRECGDDVLLLAEHILQRLAQREGGAVVGLSAATRKALMSYSFPGNVRELENVLERATALRMGNLIEPDDLNLIPSCAAQDGSKKAESSVSGLPLQDHLDEVERQVIEEALQNTRYNQTAAARLLGVTFRSLRYRIERLGIKA